MPDSLIALIISLAAIFFVIVWFRRRARAAAEVRAAYEADLLGWVNRVLPALVKTQASILVIGLPMAAIVWAVAPNSFGSDFPVFSAVGSIVLFAGVDVWLLMLRRRLMRSEE